jgi:hypothetical protein
VAQAFDLAHITNKVGDQLCVLLRAREWQIPVFHKHLSMEAS